MERKAIVKKVVRFLLIPAFILVMDSVLPRGVAYVFTGWYKGAAETPYDFDAPVTADLTLTAHWRELDLRTEAPSDRMYRPITADGKTCYAVIPVNGSYAQYVYTGSAIKPEPVVTDIS